jgi:predicted Na+-dependent transporter
MNIKSMLTIYVAIILGLFFPYGSIMKPYLNYILSVLVFFSFIKVEFKLSTFLRKELLIIALVLWGIIPFIVFWATYYLNPEVHLGLFLLSATPPAIASVVVISLIKGDLGLGIVTSVLFNVLSPLSYSVLLSIYFSQSGVDLPIQKIFISLFLIIFIPLTLIFLIQK